MDRVAKSLRSTSAVLASTLFLLGFVVVYMSGTSSSSTASAPRREFTIPLDADQSNAVDNVAVAIGATALVDATEQTPSKSSSGQVTSLEGPSPNSNRDVWDRFPRNSTPFEDMIIIGPLESTELYRNTRSNPRDHEIGAADRDRLDGYCRAMGQHLRELEQLKSRAALSDLQALIERGAARTLVLAESRKRLSDLEKKRMAEAQEAAIRAMAESLGVSADDLRKDPTNQFVAPSLDFKDHAPLAYSVRNGVAYSAVADEMPNAGAALGAQRWAMFEIGVTIIRLFADTGCLTAGEADALCRRLVSEIEAKLGS